MRRDPRQNPWSRRSRGVETESPESTSAQHAQPRADIKRAPAKHHGPHRRAQHPPKSRQANESMHATIIHSPTATATKAFRGRRRSRTASRRPTRRRSASASGSSSKFGLVRNVSAPSLLVSRAKRAGPSIESAPSLVNSGELAGGARGRTRGPRGRRDLHVSSRSGSRVVAAGLGPRRTRTRPAGREPTVPQKRQIGHHLYHLPQIERTNDRGAGARRERARARQRLRHEAAPALHRSVGLPPAGGGRHLQQKQTL